MLTASSVHAIPGGCHAVFPAANCCLETTLRSGQAFRWRRIGDAWEGIIGKRWVRLRQDNGAIGAETSEVVAHWDWLRDYLQLDADLGSIIATFPEDAVMLEAVQACAGLRLLRQDPWECLASFILSSTKQICQIERVIDRLCCHLGSPVVVPPGHQPMRAFPSVQRVAHSTEAELRSCKMGFRAPNLLATARIIDQGALCLETLGESSYEEARRKLVALPGVGEKIANCALLFSWGFPEAFPIDVWMKRVLEEHYFSNQRPTNRELQQFVLKHFGPWTGYAQQYLFHYARVIRPARVRQSGQR